MKILMLTNEYPPCIYGGAGVHVDFLCRELRRQTGTVLRVLCFGEQREAGDDGSVQGIAEVSQLFQDGSANRKVIDALGRNVAMAAAAPLAEVVHCHTWYTYLAGCLVQQFQDIPLVITVHSLEPRRPWKREQIGSGYRVSCWLEKTSMEHADGLIAVSRSMRDEILSLYRLPSDKVRVIHNGIDLSQYRKTYNPELLASYGIQPEEPYVLFVGRITRQKGLIHLVRALPDIRPGVQVVLCAGSADTPEIQAEMNVAVGLARQSSPNRIVWIPEMLPREHLVVLYSHAALFVCPSVYEPFGIINLEAMACETPVVASSVGGIPEVVLHERTGLLVPFAPVDQDDPEPRDPGKYSRDLAAAINRLLANAEIRQEMGRLGRQRVEEQFSWEAVARRTLEFYGELQSRRRPALGD